MSTHYRISYVSRILYPKPAAHALQTIKMAAAFANQTGDTNLFVRGLNQTKTEIRRHFSIEDSSLRIWSMHAELLPNCIRSYYSHINLYNTLIAGILGLNPTFKTPARIKIIFNRGQRGFGVASPANCIVAIVHGTNAERFGKPVDPRGAIGKRGHTIT